MKTDDRGFALTTILILIFVLAVAGFGTSLLTRTDTQIVNNQRSAAQAFAIAEAGAAEALMRLGLASGSNATVDGNTFDASFKGTFQPDSAHSNWRAEIVFDGTGPTLDTVNHIVRSPSIQPSSSRLRYSDVSGGTDPLIIEWDCGQASNARCPAGSTIRKIDGNNVMRITSWGRVPPARRMVSLIVTNDPGIPGLLTSFDSGKGIQMVGGASLEVSGGITVNSDSDDAVDGTNNTTIISNGEFNVVGGNDSSGTLNPPPNTGSEPMDDPLADLPIPCFGGNSSGCEEPATGYPGHAFADPASGTTGTADAPVTKTITSSMTLNPGVYYGGIAISSNAMVTLNPGIYVMAGGGFSVTTGNAGVSGTGVMIYNTQSPSAAGRAVTAGQFGQIYLKSNAEVTLHAPTSGTWQGIMIFQDRANGLTVEVQGGTPSDGVLDGIIYAISAPMTLVGGRTLQTSLIVGSIRVQGGASIVPSDITCGGCAGKGIQTIAWKDF